MTERWEAPNVDAIAIIRQVRPDQEGWVAAVNDLTQQCLADSGYDAQDLIEALAVTARVLVRILAAESNNTEDRVLDVLYARIVDLAHEADEKGGPSRVALGLTSSITTGIVSSMNDTDKVRENRLRRAAQRQGLTLAKSRRRDTRATDYGTYMLVDPSTNAVVAHGGQSGYGLSLDEIESALNE
ncbi:MAG: hypothetical protein ACYDDW_05245 [Dermatophilaceae bacterium]